MSHDTLILAKVPLPERRGGWRGQVGPAPLWYAAVSLHVRPWDDARPVYAEHAAAQGGCAQVLQLSYRHVAFEFADRYVDVLRVATGGTVITNGVKMSTLPAQPKTVEAIEQALFEQDLASLDEEPPDADGYQEQHEMDEDLYTTAYDRPQPRFGPEVDVVYLLEDDPPTAIPGVRVQSLREWAAGEPNLLGLAAQVVGHGGSLRRSRAVVTCLRAPGLSVEHKLALERFHEALVDRYRARELTLPEAWRAEP
jgi:hypothetical protein